MDRVTRRCSALVIAAWLVLAIAFGAPTAAASRRSVETSANPPAASSSSQGTLSWYHGPVLHSSAPYLVFWTPPGEDMASSTEALMARFFTDVAADSGKPTNAFAVLRQYYDQTGFADYRQTFAAAHQVIVDTQPYPPNDAVACPDVSATYPTCLSDGQVQSELQRLIVADRLPSAGSANTAFPNGGYATGGELTVDAPIYFVVLPADVSVCYSGGCSDKSLGGYHSSFTDAQRNEVLYAPIATHCCAVGPLPPGITSPCLLGRTSVPQEPNGDPGDCVINILMHEDAESITDPIPGTPHNGWAQNPFIQGEVADECGLQGPFDPAAGFNPGAYAPTLGGTEAAGTLYTQLIDNHPYYTQSVWSNGARNCEMRPIGGRIVPRFRASSAPARTGKKLSFDPAASTSTNRLSSATWNFGDGSRPVFYYHNERFPGSGVLYRAKHTYRRAGRYTVTLTLVDNRGNLETTTRRVKVHSR